MGAMTVLSDMAERLRRLLGRSSANEAFACGDCLRNEQCGNAPSPACVVRAAQIASDRKRPPPRNSFIGW